VTPDTNLIYTELFCITLLWLGLKYFFPKNAWAFWIALICGIYAGWGIWMWKNNQLTVSEVLQALLEGERYLLLFQISFMLASFLLTFIVPLLAVVMFVKNLFR
jgi:hypothetical protein